MEETLKDLLKFIQIGVRNDLKLLALEYVLGLTGAPDGLETIYNKPDFLVSLTNLLDDTNDGIAEKACICLVNISADENGAAKLIELDIKQVSPSLRRTAQDIVSQCLSHVFIEESLIRDKCCMILSNVARPMYLVDKVIDLIEKSENSIKKITGIFEQSNNSLDYLGPLVSNLSQSSKIRKTMLGGDRSMLQKYLPFTDYKESLIRRKGVIGLLKNICFETDHHELLLNEPVNILPYLLLPLFDPDEINEEDVKKLPLHLQSVKKPKQREENAEIRYVILEALTLLCTKRANREFIRNNNAYIVLRELHKKEEDEKTLLACENLVNILIRTEDEIGEDNLKEVQVPDDLIDKFNKINEETSSM